MKFYLPYGKTRLQIDIPEEYYITLIEPIFSPGLVNPENILQEALQSPIGISPLKSLTSNEDRIGIIFNDITRATPNKLILYTVLKQLTHIPRENITLFNALGTHRPNTDVELRAILDDELVENYRIVQNDCFDFSSQTNLGKTSFGHDVWINRELFECDLKILTGFIEPHFFAGFSGGGKAAMPGMAGITTILGNHGANMISHPKSTWGITFGNPIWEEINEVAHKVGRIFLVNVALNRNREICGVFCGDLDKAHQTGCDAVKKSAMQPVPESFDIVVTTNSGYPLDLNLYQTVKGMSAAAQVVKTGGSIIIAAECSDGVPEHGLYGQLLRSHQNPDQLLEEILLSDSARHDQWQVQVQAMIQKKADVFVYSELSEKQILEAMLIPCPKIEETLAKLMKKYGPKAKICVIPEGPQTIPYIQ
jgi:lactate racemase